MTACTSCHQAAYGPARGPTMVAGAFELGAGFGHADHAARIAAPCKACHGAVATTAGGDVPAPTTADCGAGGCHDGVAAFATTVACNRCHVAAPTVSYKLDITITPYSHERHRAILPDGACGGCHDLDARGEAPAPGHLACADAGCHRDDFARTAPVTCGACHVSIEPWRPLRADALPRPETEFGSTMPHHRHADLALTCAACHQLAAGTRDRRPPRGHVSCTGDACHRVGAGPTPRLDACSDCHRSAWSPPASATAGGRRGRCARASSTRRTPPRPAAPLACERCHAAVWDSDGPPAPPTKDACRGCHDGGVAFKLTGHACARCHGGG
ncbi:MAG: hypothetical protein H6709_02735 [Kofleriaceae bacterium]|nr:hypothetical protein [Kofleriaceae bacterium]